MTTVQHFLALKSLLLQESIPAERNYMVRTTKYNLNRVIERAEPEPGGTSGSMRKSVLQEWKQPLFEESGGIQLPRATADIGGTAEIIQLGPLVNEFSPSERIHESFMEAFGFLQNDSASIDLKYKRSSLPIDIDRKQIMGAETILAKIYSNVTNHLAKNEIEDALELLRYSLRSHRDKYGMLHPLVASTLHNIGVVLLFDDQYDTALSYFQQAVRIRIATFGIDHAEVSASRTKLGLIQVSKRDFDNAQVTFSQILHSRRKKLGYNDPQIIKVLNNIACVHYECGGYVAAAKSIEEALETLRKAGTDDNRSQLAMSILLSNHGFILCKRDSYQEACSAYEEASEIQQTIFPANHPTLNRTIQSLGTLWL